MTVHPADLSHPKYRSDIDGLRAVAVLAVVAFHAFPNAIEGGFIGVDVFFVISGYLISTIIFENLDRGTFSFRKFYSRRIKRIFPGLLLVLVACLTFGWFALLADEYKQLGKHVAAGAGFLSNIVFWTEAGYFDNAADTKPLLHLWSLGIEEQFYFIWPLALWFCWKRKFNFLTITAIVAVISFALNVKGVGDDLVATFYSPQTRFWELLCGSLLAWATLYKKGAIATIANRIYRNQDAGAAKLSNLMASVGVFLLVCGLLGINEGLNFPGVWALIPVTAAVLLIAAGPEAFINRTLLSNKLLVWFGLISFPLYLWHWPLLSFARIIESDEPHLTIRIAAVTLAILLAWLTYRFVERPIRFGKFSKAKVYALVSIMAAIGVAGFYTYANDGFNARKNSVFSEIYKGDVGHFEYHRYIADTYYPCTPDAVAREALKWEGFIRCIQSKPGADIDIALLGDSHAEHLFLGMAEALPDKNVVFYIRASSLFVGNPEYDNIFATIVASKSIKQVIVTEHWAERYKAIPDGSTLDKELIKVVDLLAKSGKRVYLADDIPSFPTQPLACKGIRWPHSGQTRTCQISLDDMKKQREVYADALDRVVASRPDVKIIRVGDYFCDDRFCTMTNGDAILYRDDNHLNLVGSRYAGKRMVEDNRDIFAPEARTD